MTSEFETAEAWRARAESAERSLADARAELEALRKEVARLTPVIPDPRIGIDCQNSEP